MTRSNREYELCHSLMHILSRLDIGHNRVVRHWMGVELHIFLSEGKDALEKYRKEEANGWG